MQQLYGPTEDDGVTTCYVDGVRESMGTIPIGEADGEHADVHSGRAWGAGAGGSGRGVVHRRGAGVARGYLNRAELTAERFVPDLLGREGAGGCTGRGTWGGGCRMERSSFWGGTIFR